MSGRGRPGRSGPLDGAGRRSVYLQLRRNFVNPFFSAFDKPNPVSTRGRRSESNVPAQALSLLNDDFVIGQATVWAKRALASATNEDARIDAMFVDALGRAPSDDERKRCSAFLAEVYESGAKAPRTKSRSVAAWSELAHVLFNLKEFAWIR